MRTYYKVIIIFWSNNSCVPRDKREQYCSGRGCIIYIVLFRERGQIGIKNDRVIKIPAITQNELSSGKKSLARYTFFRRVNTTD